MKISIEDQIYICQNIDKLGLTELQKELEKYSKEQIEEFVRTSKENGVYAQYRGMTRIEKAVEHRPVGRPKKIVEESAIKETAKEENVEFYKGKCEAYQEIIKKLIERGV